MSQAESNPLQAVTIQPTNELKFPYIYNLDSFKYEIPVLIVNQMFLPK